MQGCKVEVLNVVRDETFGGKDHERRDLQEEDELAEIAGNKASKIPRSVDHNLCISNFNHLDR